MQCFHELTFVADVTGICLCACLFFSSVPNYSRLTCQTVIANSCGYHFLKLPTIQMLAFLTPCFLTPHILFLFTSHSQRLSISSQRSKLRDRSKISSQVHFLPPSKVKKEKQRLLKGYPLRKISNHSVCELPFLRKVIGALSCAR